MDISTNTPHTTAPRLGALFYKIPFIGWIARDVAHGSVSEIYYAIVAFVSLWGISILTFGLPGLYLPALAMVPVIFFMLIWITLGRLDPPNEEKE